MQTLTRWLLALLFLGLSLALVPHCKDKGSTASHQQEPARDTVDEPLSSAEPVIPEPTLRERPPEVRKSPHPDLPPGVRRLVTFGDVHGDLEATRKVLRLIGAIDKNDRWIGGTMRVVQTGDILDRGDQEQAILDMFWRLRDEAKKAGGAFIVLNGNHEVMNVQWDFRYVTPGGWADFKDVPGLPNSNDPGLDMFTPEQRPRALAFMPGGPYANMLSHYPVMTIVEGTLFVHGGALPKHIDYGIEKLNKETAAWMRGEQEIPAPMAALDSPVWNRDYSLSTDDSACALLKQTLQKAGAARMVVGHTPHTSGVSSACGDKVWRVDTGLASYYRGVIQALELTKGHVRILGKPAP